MICGVQIPAFWLVPVQSFSPSCITPNVCTSSVKLCFIQQNHNCWSHLGVCWLPLTSAPGKKDTSRTEVPLVSICAALKLPTSVLLTCGVFQGLSALQRISPGQVGATVLSALGLAPAQPQKMIISALRSLIFLNCKDLQQY